MIPSFLSNSTPSFQLNTRPPGVRTSSPSPVCSAVRPSSSWDEMRLLGSVLTEEGGDLPFFVPPSSLLVGWNVLQWLEHQQPSWATVCPQVTHSRATSWKAVGFWTPLRCWAHAVGLHSITGNVLLSHEFETLWGFLLHPSVVPEWDPAEKFYTQSRPATSHYLTPSLAGYCTLTGDSVFREALRGEHTPLL